MSGANYTSAFGAILDDEIAGALRSGMPLETIYIELQARQREIADALVRRHLEREEQRCAA
jgi:hypothetical protein